MKRLAGTSQPASLGGSILWSLVAALVAAFLYVATWPIIEIKYGLASRFPIIASISRPPIWQTKEWAEVVYYPLHRWRDSDNGRNLAARYWDWWNGRLPLIL